MKLYKLLLSILALFFITSCSIYADDNISFSNIESNESTIVLDPADYYSYYGTFYSLQEIYLSKSFTDEDMYNICYQVNYGRFVTGEEEIPSIYDSSKIKKIDCLDITTYNKLKHDYYNSIMTDGCDMSSLVVKKNYDDINFKYCGTYNEYIIGFFSGVIHDYLTDTEEHVIVLGNYSFNDYDHIYVWKEKKINNAASLPTKYNGTFYELNDLYKAKEIDEDDLYNIYYYNFQISSGNNGITKKEFDLTKIKEKAVLSDDIKKKILDDYYLLLTIDKCKIKVDYESVRFSCYAGTYNDYVICTPLAPHDFDDYKYKEDVYVVSNYDIKVPMQDRIVYGWKMD